MHKNTQKRLPAKSYPWSQAATLLLSLLLALPILSILLALMTPTSDAWLHLRETLLTEYIVNSLLLMLQVGCYTLIIGVSTAWLVSATEFPGRRWLSWALVLPLAAPAYIVAYVYTDLLDFSGPVQSTLREALQLTPGQYWFPQIRSLTGAAIILSLVLYPYVYLLSRAAFMRRSTTLFNAARVLGAKPSRAFLVIALPAARPAIVGGVALVLMETLADFGVVDYFSVPTFATGIFRSWFAMGEKVAAMKLAAVMFLFVIALVVLEKYQRREVGASAQATDGRTSRIPLRGRHAILACLFCSAPVLLGCIVPMAVLLNYAIQVGDPLLEQGFIQFVINSVSIAAITAFIATAIALLLSYSAQYKGSRTTTMSVQIATMGYALPGIILAVALLTPISSLDRWLAEILNNTLGWQVGLLLTGTTATLIYAYVVRFLTVAYNTTSSGLMQIPPVFNQAARSLGANRRHLIRRIHIPLMRPSVLTALILVFVDTMRELPATLILRPFNFETLATRAYRLASDERIAEASTASLSIMLIGLIPVLMLSRNK